MNVYKVRNDKNESYEVDEDKLHEAEKDGYLPVVSNGTDEFRVGPNDFDKAAADGFKPIVRRDAANTGSSLYQDFQDFAGGMREGFPLSGLIEKAAAVPVAALDYITTDKSFGQAYDDVRAEQDADDAARQERSPVLNTAGNVAGAFVAPAPTGGGIAGRVAANAALAGADAATRQDSLDTALAAGKDAASMGGTVTFAAETLLPAAGKFLRAAGRATKKVVPGAEGSSRALNKAVAKGSQLFGSVDDDVAQTYEKMLNDPKAYRAALDAKDDLMKNLPKYKGQIADTVNTVDDAISKAYSVGQDKAIAKNLTNIDDYRGLIASTSDNLKGKLAHVLENKEFYGAPAKRALLRASKTLEKESPQLRAAAEVPAKLDELYEKYWRAAESGDMKALQELEPQVEKLHKEVETFVNEYGNLLVTARRHLDDGIHWANSKPGRRPDEDLLKSVRRELDQIIAEGMPGGGALKEVDKLYSDYKRNAAPFLDLFKGKDIDGLSDRKIASYITDAGGFQRASREAYKQSAKDFLDKTQEMTGIDSKVISDLDEKFRPFADAQDLSRLGAQTGATTGRTLLGATPLIAGTALGNPLLGAAGSAIAAPVTNPTQYLRTLNAVRNTLDTAKASKAAGFIRALGEAAKRGNSAFATTHYMLSKMEPEYQELVQQAQQLTEDGSEVPEAGLEDEGVFDVLRPIKQAAKQKAEEAGVPRVITEAADLLTPDGIPLPVAKGGAALKKMLPAFKYKPSDFADLPGDAEHMEDAIADWTGHGFRDVVRRQKGLAPVLLSEDEVRKEVQGLKSATEWNDLETPENIIRLHKLQPDENLEDILNAKELRSDTFKSFSSAEDPSELMNFGNTEIMYRVKGNKSGRDISPFSTKPHEKEVLIPEGVTYQIEKISKLPINEVFKDPEAQRYIREFMKREKLVEGKTERQAYLDLLERIYIIDLIEKSKN